jgi:hypothetical protein
MATYTPKRLYQGSPTTETTPWYTCPAATKTIVKQLVAANITGATLTFSVSVVPSGQTAGATNRIAGTVPVGANNTVVLDLFQVLGVGDFLSGLVSAAGLVLTISGIEQT